MKSELTGIPIAVGVTGHRDLREQDLPALRKTVCAELKKIEEEYPHSRVVMLNSLAAGADTLCAQEALKLGIAVRCPLPMDQEEYRKDFSEENLQEFDRLIEQAETVFTVGNTEPAPSRMSRSFCYRQAGIYIASHCHVLLALWDGKPAEENGCGTAETADFVLNGSYQKQDGSFHIADDGAVIHITAPRKGSSENIEIKSELLENNAHCLRDYLQATDRFNEDLKRSSIATESLSLLPQADLEKCGPELLELNCLYDRTNSLSLYYQKKYLRAMKVFSVYAVLLVLSFLLYDELESWVFLVIYGAVIAVYAVKLMVIRKRQYHQKYLEYRVFAEVLRVQFFLHALNIDRNAGSLFTWTQNCDIAWIKKAMSVLMTGDRETSRIDMETVRENWIDGQKEYHQKACRKDAGKFRFNEGLTKAMLICSILMFAAVCAVEYFLPHLMTLTVFPKTFSPMFFSYASGSFELRSLLKVILGILSAVTLFASNYYGKLSLGRKCTDHRKMIRLYTEAEKKYLQKDCEKKELFTDLAREEMIENGEWFSYCKENTFTMNV